MIRNGAGSREKWKDAGLTVLCVVAAWAALSVCFDFYYDLNDDMAMKDILSGTYTGIPDGHNIQMLYPLGWLLAFCYRFMPTVPWYGVFLCGCQFLALQSCLFCVVSRLEGRGKKMAAAISLTAAALALFLYEFVFVQYTVTAALLVLAAMVRLFTCPSREAAGWRLLRQLITAALVGVAFYLRTEITLLLCPFLLLAAGWRIIKERQMLRGYAVFFLTTALLMGLGLAADGAAYASPEWRSFRQFFDERTRVYDFYGLPDYEKHRDFYDTIGIAEAEYTLLDNYNFDLDDEIDTKVMTQIADYAASHQEPGAARRLYLSVYTYLYRFTHGQELIFDLLTVFSYFFLFRAAVRRRQGQLFRCLVILLTLRTILWLFLLYRGRVPERITHPLYLAELIMLGLLFLQEGEAFGWKKYEKWAILSLYVLVFVCTAAVHTGKVREEYGGRETRNVQWQDWKAYCREHPQRFYFLDVYSTVAYSEKMFGDCSPAYRNFDLLGGWCVKSPLAKAKREAAECDSAQMALAKGRALFVADPMTKTWKADFLPAYYRETGTEILMQEVDTCGRFSVYGISEHK